MLIKISLKIRLISKIVLYDRLIELKAGSKLTV